MKLVFSFLVVVLLCTSCSQTKVEQAESLKVHNPLGIVFKSKKATTIETSAGGPCTFYVVDAANVPPNRRFYLYMADDAPSDYPSLEVVSDGTGCLRLASNQNILLREYLIAMSYKLPGEVSSVWLASENKNNIVKTSFVPYPLQTFGSDGAEVSVIRTKSDGTFVQCKGTYFQDKECLQITLRDKDNYVERRVVCCKGSFSLNLVPPSSKSYGGMITLHITRQNGDVMELCYPWGREAFNKDLFKCNYSKFTQEDWDKIDDAVDCYYKKTSPDALV